MTLEELSREYRKSAKLLSDRLAQLRGLLRQAEDPEEVFQLKRRIAELTPILTEMRAISDLTEHYYERGHYRNEQYSSNCFREQGGARRQAKAYFGEDCSERVDGAPAGYVHLVPLEEREHHPDRQQAGSSQKHRKPHFEEGRAEGGPVYPICEISGELLEMFFPSEPSG